MRAGLRIPAACASLAIALALAAPAGALPTPDLVAALGGTSLVAGEPDRGGATLSLSALWPVEGPWAFGLMVFADDMGTDLGRLRDPNDGTDLGATALRHRFAFGAAWRMDAALPALGRWEPHASGTWGAYRVQDDVRGEPVGALCATGVSLGAGLRYPLGLGSLGAAARWHRLMRGDAEQWLSAGIDWQWRWGHKP
jgi:hypothetical protein